MSNKMTHALEDMGSNTGTFDWKENEECNRKCWRSNGVNCKENKKANVVLYFKMWIMFSGLKGAANLQTAADLIFLEKKAPNKPKTPKPAPII